MCMRPLTVGGGVSMLKSGAVECGSKRKMPHSSQARSHFSSMACTVASGWAVSSSSGMTSVANGGLVHNATSGGRSFTGALAWGHGRLAILRTVTLALALLLATPLVLAQPVQTYLWMPAQGEPDPETGPDVPTATAPLATVVAFENETWAWTSGERTHTIDVPSGWDRVVMEYNQHPQGDPWDRLFIVLFERVEVLRGTTPRSDMTITKDMTRYGALLPQGGVANVTVDTSAWEIGPQVVTLTLRFYHDATSALVEKQHDHAISGYANQGLCKGSVIDVPVTFPASAPRNGTLEVFATGHGSEEV